MEDETYSQKVVAAVVHLWRQLQLDRLEDGDGA
jgi:hypothetical protein